MLQDQPSDINQFGKTFFQERVRNSPPSKRQKTAPTIDEEEEEEEEEEDLDIDHFPVNFNRGKRKSVFTPAPKLEDLLNITIEK